MPTSRNLPNIHLFKDCNAICTLRKMIMWYMPSWGVSTKEMRRITIVSSLVFVRYKGITRPNADFLLLGHSNNMQWRISPNHRPFFSWNLSFIQPYGRFIVNQYSNSLSKIKNFSVQEDTRAHWKQAFVLALFYYLCMEDNHNLLYLYLLIMWENKGVPLNAVVEMCITMDDKRLS